MTMKKLILSIVCLILMGVLSIQAQTAKIILQHGDEAKIFASYQLQNAINEAVDNDVIYLNDPSNSHIILVIDEIDYLYYQ